MRSKHSLSRVLLVLSSLSVTACWPGVASLGFLGGGGGGGGGSAANTQLGGTIVVGATDFGGGFLDHEPNDSMGFANAAGLVSDRHPKLLNGHASASLKLQALIEAADGTTRLLTRDVLCDAPDRSQRFMHSKVRTEYRPTAMARSGRSLLLLERKALGSDEARIREVSTSGGMSRWESSLQLPGQELGAVHLLGVFFVLMRTQGGSRLLALDARTGVEITSIDLGASLTCLAGGEDFTTGAPRLFAWDDEAHHVVQIEIGRFGSDYRLTGMIRSLSQEVGGSSLDNGAIAALAFDGVFLYAAAIDGNVRVLHARTAELVGELAPLAGGRVVALAAQFDPGIDGFQLEQEAGSELTLALQSARTGADGSHNDFVLVAIDRERALLREGNPVLTQVRVNGALSDSSVVVPGITASRPIDLVVATLEGGGSYQVLAGAKLGSPGLRSDMKRSRHPTAVAMQDHLRSSVLSALSSERIAELYCNDELADHVPGEVAFAYREEFQTMPTPSATRHFLLSERSSSPSGFRSLAWTAGSHWSSDVLRTFQGTIPPEAERREARRELLAVLLELDRIEGVDWCEPVYRVAALARIPNDPNYTGPPGQTWHYEQIKLPDAWDTSIGNLNVTVAIVDSGVRTEASDLAVRLFDGFDFVNDAGNSGDGDGRDGNPYDESGFDSHGTHVSGTIGAAGNNKLAVSGVLWQSAVMPLRAIGSDGTGSTLDIAEAIRYGARLNNASGMLPPRAADVINLSLGSPAPSNAMRQAIQAAINNGVIVVAASGNDGVEGVYYPAAFDICIAVGATDIDENRADYSNWGPELDVVAPGGSGISGDDRDGDGFVDWVLSTVGSMNGTDEGLLAFFAGTSMACPHAAGVAGLLKSINPSITQSQVMTVFQNTSKNLDDAGDSSDDLFFGSGLVDAAAALNFSIPILALSADNLDFGVNGTDLIIQAFNEGNGTLVVESIGVTDVIGGSTAWISSELLTDGRSIALRADRGPVAEGVYQVQVDVNTNGGIGSVLVAMSKSAAPLPDIGVVIVELRDLSGKLLKRDMTQLSESYQYTLRGFKRGTFRLSSGVDTDQDGVICEPGEPCGFYPINSAPEDLIFQQISALQVDLVVE